MRKATLRFLALVIAVFLMGSAAPGQAQGAFAHGTIVGLQGTPHLWFADEHGILHWGGDTRALAGRHIDWDNRAEVSLDQLRALPIGDPWLTAGLLKDGDPIYLVKWETEWPQPRLLHIQSIQDVELFGINGSNYGRFVYGGEGWNKTFGIDSSYLEKGVLSPVMLPDCTSQGLQCTEAEDKFVESSHEKMSRIMGRYVYPYLESTYKGLDGQDKSVRDIRVWDRDKDPCLGTAYHIRSNRERQSLSYVPLAWQPSYGNVDAICIEYSLYRTDKKLFLEILAHELAHVFTPQVGHRCGLLYGGIAWRHCVHSDPEYDREEDRVRYKMRGV